MLTIKAEDGKVKVKSQYNSQFVRRARALKGKWNSPYWEFDETEECEVRAVCLAIFGEDGNTAVEKVDVELNLNSYMADAGLIRIDTLILAERTSRDRDVVLADNVIVIKGAFPGSGGSVKNPHTNHRGEGIVLKVKGLPLTKYEKIKNENGVKLLTKTVKKEDLLAEKAKLEKRLGEIAELLK